MNTLLVSITDFIQLAWERLTDGFAIKTVMAIFATIGIWLLGLKHVQVLGIFICLVFIDLLTKWVAISYQMLLDMGASPENIRMTDKYWAIPAASYHLSICVSRLGIKYYPMYCLRQQHGALIIWHSPIRLL